MQLEKDMICANCGYVGKKERFSQGNFVLEMFLWVLFFLPGALYTTWRAFNEYEACPKCRNREMAPLDSNFGQQILGEKQRMREPLTVEEQTFFSNFLKNSLK